MPSTPPNLSSAGEGTTGPLMLEELPPSGAPDETWVSRGRCADRSCRGGDSAERRGSWHVLKKSGSRSEGSGQTGIRQCPPSQRARKLHPAGVNERATQW